MRIRTRAITIPFIVGRAMHKAFELLMDPKTQESVKELMPSARMAIDGIFEETLNKSDLLTSTDLHKLEHGRAQVHAMIDAWFVINGDQSKKWQFSHTEMKIRSKDGVTKDSPITHRMAGMIDGLFLYQEQLWILEHKSRQRLDDLNIEGLNLDMQALFYIIICRDVVGPQEIDGKQYMPTGFYYNAIQKPQHRLNEKGFQDCKSRMYNAMVSDPEKYFSLTPILIEKNIISRAYQNFERIQKEMDSLTADTVFMNTTSCDDYGGCPYKSLCLAGADASYPKSVLDMPGIDLFEIAPIHEELEE